MREVLILINISRKATYPCVPADAGVNHNVKTRKNLRRVGALPGAADQAATEPVSSSVRQVLQEAIAQGYGNDNITGLAQLY